MEKDTKENTGVIEINEAAEVEKMHEVKNKKKKKKKKKKQKPMAPSDIILRKIIIEPPPEKRPEGIDHGVEMKEPDPRTLEVVRIKELRREFRSALAEEVKSLVIGQVKSGWLPSIESITTSVMETMAGFLSRNSNETANALILVLQSRSPSIQQEELKRQLNSVKPLEK